MHGGLKIYRGAAAAARHYVEADRSRADDYYLAEGSGLAMHVISRRRSDTGSVILDRSPDLDGDTYERWVAGLDVDTGAAKGRLRKDDQAVRFLEVTVNGPKTWSLAAALHPDIAEAYDAAQMAAADEIVTWLGTHATTRVGPRGRQVQVPVEQLDAAVVRHFTSRAGDPHRHLHLQINARVFAAGAWRGIHTVGVRDSLEAINGIGHAAVMTNPEFRDALATHGFHLDPETGEVAQLASYVAAFSARARQIEANIETYESEWRDEHPDEEPGPALRQAWDRRAWADARPDKVVPISGEDLRRRWIEDLTESGFTPPPTSTVTEYLKPGELNRDAVVDLTLHRLAAKHSAWNEADLRGEVERIIAGTGEAIDPVVRRELAEDLTARAVASSKRLLEQADVPEHIRSLTSDRVVAVERELIDRINRRGSAGALSIIEGAAGAGKTTRLATTRQQVESHGHRMVVVTPTRKASQVASGAIGAPSYSAAWLLHQHGFRWDEDGRWTRVTSSPDTRARLRAGDLLVIDEAGMVDQDTARALLRITDEARASVMLVGDRHQLPAVGRGGLLDLAARYAPDRVSQLDHVRRFTDPEYADLSLRMRTGDRPGDVFDELLRRGEIVVHASDAQRQGQLAQRASVGDLVVADTRDQVAKVNLLTQTRCRAFGDVTDAVLTAAGERIGVGDRIATRRNDRDADVANRETWTVIANDRGQLTIQGEAGRRVLTPEYVRQHVELAYATTVHGAQGSTVPVSHVVVGEHTGAASAYVGMTRGRESNVAHLVADSVEEAREQWIGVFSRDRADLGPTYAREAAAEAVERYRPMQRPYVSRPPLRRSRPTTPPPNLTPRPPAPSRGPGLGM